MKTGIIHHISKFMDFSKKKLKISQCEFYQNQMNIDYQLNMQWKVWKTKTNIKFDANGISENK